MQKYLDINKDSGISFFQNEQDRIIVWFKGNPKPYIYTYLTASPFHVEKMKQLALSGDGLNAYIKRHVNDRYEKQTPF